MVPLLDWQLNDPVQKQDSLKLSWPDGTTSRQGMGSDHVIV